MWLMIDFNGQIDDVDIQIDFDVVTKVDVVIKVAIFVEVAVVIDVSVVNDCCRRPPPDDFINMIVFSV